MVSVVNEFETEQCCFDVVLHCMCCFTARNVVLQPVTFARGGQQMLIPHLNAEH